jgi:UPF0755 protein
LRNRLGAMILLACLGASLGYAVIGAYSASGPLPDKADIVVPRGGLAAVADALRAGHVVNSVMEFRVFALATAWQGPLRAAELSFPAHAGIATVLAVLRNGRPVEHLLTIPEGVTSARIATLLAETSGLSGEIDVPREGSVLPQTYAYERGASRLSVIRRGQEAMARALARAWAARAPGLSLHDVRDLLILSSLVERETHLAAERPVIARAFYNRLQKGMRLQSDPTVAYAESGGTEELPSGLTRSALERVGPYNTYAGAGLPAGPICNPGIASIEAAAHPAESSALYFVADGAGGHIFSDSLAEHARNVERYRHLPR